MREASGCGRLVGAGGGWVGEAGGSGGGGGGGGRGGGGHPDISLNERRPGRSRDD